MIIHPGGDPLSNFRWLQAPVKIKISTWSPNFQICCKLQCWHHLYLKQLTELPTFSQVLKQDKISLDNSYGRYAVAFSVPIFWHSVGVIRAGDRFAFWLAKWIGEALVRYLEFSTFVPNVDHLATAESAYVWECGKIRMSTFRLLCFVAVWVI